MEGLRDVARRAEVLQTTSSIAVVAGTQSYSAPSDTVRIYRAEFTPTGTSEKYPLEYRDYNSMDAVWGASQAITQGTPELFTMWGYPGSLTVYLYPTPSMAGTLKVFYYRLPADLATNGSADSTNVDIPEGWWDLALLYAEYTALRKDGDRRWTEAKQLYEEKLDEMTAVSRRWTDQADSLDPTSRHLPEWLTSGEYF